MAEDGPSNLSKRIRHFDWNPKKRQGNLRDHKIDFEDVRGFFDRYHIVRRSDRHGEVRYEAFGYVNDREVAVAFTLRGEVCWLISARRASRKERREFYHRLTGRSSMRED